MSTRCNVVLRGADGREVVLYRHHDGHLADAGADVLRFAVQYRRYLISPERAANWFLRQRYDDGRVIYELTDGLHGDIDHAYVVDLPDIEGEETIVGHADRHRIREARSKDVSGDDLRPHAMAYGVADFCQAVNEARREVNGLMNERGMKGGRFGTFTIADVAGTGREELIEAT